MVGGGHPKGRIAMNTPHNIKAWLVLAAVAIGTAGCANDGSVSGYAGYGYGYYDPWYRYDVIVRPGYPPHPPVRPVHPIEPPHRPVRPVHPIERPPRPTPLPARPMPRPAPSQLR